MTPDRAARLPWPLLAAVALLGALPWLQATGFAFVDLDDPDYVTANPVVAAGLTFDGVGWAFTTFHAQNWHPLTWLSHMLDCSLFGADAAGAHHAVNVALHALNAALLCAWLLRLGARRSLAAGLALLWAVHPVQAECVAWVAQRKSVLSTTFALACLLAWTRWARSGSRGAFAAAHVALALGLLAKPMLVTLPFALLVLDAWPLARSARGWRRLVAEKGGMLLLVAAAAAATYAAQAAGGAVAGSDLVGLGDRAGNAAWAVARYLGHLAWPSCLCAYYPHAVVDGGAVGAAAIAVGVAVVAAATVAAVAVRRRLPQLPVAWLLFAGMLVPVLGLVQVGGQALADRYLYLPTVGLLLAAVHCRRGLAAWPWVAAAVLGAVTWHQVPSFADSEALARRMVACAAPNAMGELLLGNAARVRRDAAAAERHYAAARAVRPRWFDAVLGHGAALDDLGRLDDAEVAYRAAIALDGTRAIAHANLGRLLARRGRPLEAAEALRAALRCASPPERAARRLDELLVEQLLRAGQRQDAIEHLRRAVRELPDQPHLAALLQRLDG